MKKRSLQWNRVFARKSQRGTEAAFSSVWNGFKVHLE